MKMIKLNAMRYSSFFLFLLISVLSAGILPVFAQSIPAGPVVIAPRAGEAVQGRVEISGTTSSEGFQRAEVEYRYVNDPKDTWFPIAESDQPVNPGKITEWDTSVVTDGNYDLRITVCLKDGTCHSTTIAGIRVRNYSPVETATPQNTNEVPVKLVTQETSVPTRTPRPTQAALPDNQAVLTKASLNSSLIRGGIAGIGFFVVFGIYWLVKRSLL